MRPLALVLVITLVGSCVPLPAKKYAVAGNLALLAASVDIAHDELARDCNKPDDPLCTLSSTVTIGIAEIVAMAAFIGLGRTLAAKRAP